MGARSAETILAGCKLRSAVPVIKRKLGHWCNRECLFDEIDFGTE